MNKPKISPPKGWRVLEAGEIVKASDKFYFCGKMNTVAIKIIGRRAEYYLKNLYGLAGCYIRRIRRAPAKSLAAVLYESYMCGGNKWSDAYPDCKAEFRRIARAARRHIAREGKR